MKKLLIAITLITGISTSAFAGQCGDSINDWVVGDPMTGITIVTNDQQLTMYVDNVNKFDRTLRDIESYGFDNGLAKSLQSKGCINPTFIPMYNKYGQPNKDWQSIDPSTIDYIYRHI